MPDYRVPVFEALRTRLPGGLTIFCGDDDFAEDVSISSELTEYVYVKNAFFAGRRLLWQRRTVGLLSRPDTAMLVLNPRILSTWVILVVRRLRGRRSVLFGHAWPRRGSNARTDLLRHLMRRLADAIVVYTDSQARELSRRMPGYRVHSAPNALYPRALAVHDASERQGRDVVCVGRLVDAKKPRLLLDAFARAAPRLPHETRLVFVGDGPLLSSLEARARDLDLSDRVDFAGHVGEFERLRALYARALVSVSPGYAGLSLTQSLWFGVPALIADDEPHSPEIEAADPGRNAVFFASDAQEALSDALLEIFRDRDLWLARGREIADACVQRYSLESMVDAIVRALEA